jgi:hypothetical protein
MEAGFVGFFLKLNYIFSCESVVRCSHQDPWLAPAAVLRIELLLKKEKDTGGS